MSKFVEDFEWEWEFNKRVKAETIPEVILRLKKGETLETENKRLREALEEISHDPCHSYEGCVCPRGIAIEALKNEANDSTGND